ncbi:MAG: sigma-54-dependent Fis family transcriptional regulator [Alphaproteobacteria bacterium]|nr:sigma-54-dependent Fis family transcriptional regulator [Alphaproteobacteria bacterium]
MDILVADDEDDIREQVCAILEDEGYQPRSCATIAEAQAAIQQRLPSMAILDVWFRQCDKDGLFILENLQRLSPGLPVIMVSGHGTVDMAVRALKIGACDFLTKPFSLDGLLHAVERGLREAQLTRENQDMARQLGKRQPLTATLSPAMAMVTKNLEQWAKTDRRLLVTGGAGVGKSRLVQHIHQVSSRTLGGLQRHNCAGFSDDDTEAMVLFGKEDGGVGKLELAHGGTLVLENVNRLSVAIQQLLVQFLHSKRFRRVGQNQRVKVDVRILCTSEIAAADLRRREGFSQSLYDCIALGVLELPPLRRRPEDLPALIANIQERLNHKLDQAAPEVGAESLGVLQSHHWPNNVRELENVLTRLHYSGSVATPELVHRAIGDEANHQQHSRILQWQKLIGSLAGGLRSAREEFEQQYLCYHLERFGGNVSQTAQFVGMDRASLHRKMRNLGIDGSMD